MLSPDQIVRLRPHFQLRDGALHFLNSDRALLPVSEAESALIEDLRGGRAVADLQARHGDILDHMVDKLVVAGMADVITPVTGTRRKVLVLEPHSDDAALSIGGTMWQRRNELDFTLITLASRSNYSSSFHTHRPFFVRDEVTALRSEEGEIYMQYLGGSYRGQGLREATLRYHDDDWSLEFFKAHRASVSAGNNRRAPDDVFDLWMGELETLLRGDDAAELWIPVGAGTHGDHDLTRNVILSVLMGHPDLFAKYRVVLYQDVPYDSEFPEHTARILSELRAAGATLRPVHEDITDSLETKMDLLAIFASQFKAQNVRHGVVTSATVPDAPDTLREHLWQVDALPDGLDFNRLYMDAPAVSEATIPAQAWVQELGGARHVRVLALAASGRWHADLDLLRDLAPNARIDVYAGPGARAEIEGFASDNLHLHRVDRGGAAWVMLAVKLALKGRAHTLFVAGDRIAQARKLARLWPLSRTLTVRAMDHAYLALSRTRDR